MNNELFLQLISVAPFLTLEGVAYAIWTYRLSWSEALNWKALIGLGTQDTPAGVRLAMEFSRRIAIRDPGQYPQVLEIQMTGIDKPDTGAVQFAYRDFQGSPVSPIAFSFIAPAAQDTFCPVKLVQRPAVEVPWSNLSFKVLGDGDIAFQQVITGPSVICPSVAQPSTDSNVLEHSSRMLLKATHVPLDVPGGNDITARGKYSFVRQLSLQPGEVQTVVQAMEGAEHGSPKADLSSGLLSLLRRFERSPFPTPLPPPSIFAAIPTKLLKAFGLALTQVRKHAANQHQASGAGQGKTASVANAHQALLHAAVVANMGLEINSTLLPSPIGMLNLERLEMAPAGIERGELIATIPLAPGEKTAVVQKEWSVTTKEFTSIVTDSLENYSETGVTDNTELAQSTTSQIQHANQFNITGTVSGGIPLISGSTTATFGAQDSASQSATESRNHAVSVTQKASSRTKKEHKVTISTSTVTGASETTTRELVNTSPTDAIRIDYFSMMRKWRVRLYRYGLRLTYDIVIPEPAAQFRKAYAELEDLRTQVGPFTFGIQFTDISRVNWASFAAQYEVNLPEPPADPAEKTFTSPYSTDGSSGYKYFTVDLDLPDGYVVSSAKLTANQAVGNDPNTWPVPFLNVMHVGQIPDPPDPSQNQDKTASLDFLVGLSGRQYVTYGVASSLGGVIEVAVKLQLTTEGFEAWQEQAWGALYNAAQTQYYAEQQDIAAKIATLEDKLNNVDTLTLRREESDEMMRVALRFLLGVGYDYMNDVVDVAVKQSEGYTDPVTGQVVFTTDPKHGVAFTSNQVIINGLQLFAISDYESDVRFINQAIEWENVVTFLYSYFWDMPESWDFIRQIKHSDATRQAFLRAGSARVVLTVRKGWETAWESYVDGAPPDPRNPPPRFTIAQEIAAYDDRNYPGIPPANPGRSSIRLEDAVVATSTMALPPPGMTLPLKNVEIEVDSSEGFVVGAHVLVDSGVHIDNTNPFGWQEETTIVAVSDKHITVAYVEYEHGGDNVAYPVVQTGEKGLLIAEWNEYTPTSGTDIAVTSNLTTIS